MRPRYFHKEIKEPRVRTTQERTTLTWWERLDRLVRKSDFSTIRSIFTGRRWGSRIQCEWAPCVGSRGALSCHASQIERAVTVTVTFWEGV